MFPEGYPVGGKFVGRAVGIVAGLTLALIVSFGAFLAYGSWQAASLLQTILTVGGPTAQGDGWPVPQIPADIGYAGDPRQAYGYRFDDIRLGSEVGDLPAWLVPPAEGGVSAQRWAIFVHGIGGRRENGYRFLPTLHDAGLPVIMMSYRNDEGAPASKEGIYAFGLTEWRDLEAAVEYALDHGAGSVLIVAESMGGAIAGQFLRRSRLARQVSAIILDAPALDFPALVAAQIGRDGIPFAGGIAHGGFLILRQRIGLDFSQAYTLPEFASFSGPLFLSHGAGDQVVPVASSDRLVSERSAPTEYLRTEADHIQSWKANPDAYDRALAAFLADLP
jgi:uncharacterized protein